jgi:hypothetical protein
MTREHRVSRRVLLGAACAAAVPIPAGAFAASSFERRLEAWRRWDRAIALVRRAAVRLEHCRTAAPRPAGDGNANDDAAADEALFDSRLGAFYRALRRLLRTPAPDLRALSLKLDLAVEHEVAELTGGKACLIALKRDARRLASLRSS